MELTALDPKFQNYSSFLILYNSEYEHHVDTNFCDHLGNEALRLYGTGIDKKEIR